MGRWRTFERPFLFGVTVEAGHRAQPTRDTRPSASPRFEIPTEALDAGPPHAEQAQVVLLAPGDELAQIEGVRLEGQPPVPREERHQRVPLGIGELGVNDSDFDRVGVVFMSHLQVRPRPGGRSRPASGAS